MNLPPEDVKPDGPSAYFTLSLLIDSVQINRLLRRCGVEGNVWNQSLLDELREPPHAPTAGQASYLDTRPLQNAINPMFEDIADRERNLFIEDFLLDTPNAPGTSRSFKNVCAEIELLLPGAVRWQTEGHPSVRVEPGVGQGTCFPNVPCRAFWMAHSNHSLSYHLSFEVHFEHGLCDYFGLAMLQKAFFASEHTHWLNDDVQQGWQVNTTANGQMPLLVFIERLFETHTNDLMKAVAQHAKFSDELPARFAKQAWQELVLRGDDEDKKNKNEKSRRDERTPSTAERWNSAARRRRLLVLLRDDHFSKTLKLSQKDPDRWMLEPIKPIAEGHDLVYRADEIERNLAAQVAQLNSNQPGLANPYDARQCRSAMFLAGFLQNIVDFLHQDDLELHDGLAPIYPTLESNTSNKGFMLFATQSVMYEVVGTSRSLDDTGRQWLGTCPYLFLVHMTAFHNESLVGKYERDVCNLVRHLEDKGLKSDADSAGEKFESVLDEAFNCIKDFRLVTFEQVHKHYSFNIFRYETERTIFDTLKDVRGIGPRRDYWEGVLNHLTETIDGMKQERSARYERTISGYGLALAATGLMQVWLMLFPPYSELQPQWLYANINGVVAVALLAAWLWNRRKLIPRKQKHSGKAWRRVRRRG